MIYKKYSHAQIETMANELNKRYDSNRLKIPKAVDVYDIVDMLDARIAFEYLSPDRTYLGATLFRDGAIYVWPGNPFKKGMMPEEKLFYGGTIIIDRDINESHLEQDHFVENYTVMHECFHFDKHQEYFNHSGHFSKSMSERNRGLLNKSSALYKIERQADYAAAAFLMPRDATYKAARDMLGYRGKTLDFGYRIKDDIKEIGKMFGVNYSPMLYRLQELKIVEEEFNPYL